MDESFAVSEIMLIFAPLKLKCGTSMPSKNWWRGCMCKVPHKNTRHKECFSKLKRVDKIMRTIFLTFLVFAFCACATKTKIEYRDRIVDHYNTIVQHDTLREHTSDSIFEKIYVKGDTVYITKYVGKTR